MEFQRTGIVTLDQMIGGIPRGSRNIVIGPPGTGKTVFAMHFLWAGLQAEEVVACDVFDRPWPHMRNYFARFGWNVAPYEASGRLIAVQSFPHFEPFPKDAQVRYFHLDDFAAMQAIDMELTAAGCSRFVFVDGYSHLFRTLSDAQWHEIENWTINWSYYSRMTNLDVVNEFPSGEDQVRRLMDYTLFTAHNIFRFRLREHGSSYVREMRIEKMEGVAHPLDWMRFEITSHGIALETP